MDACLVAPGNVAAGALHEGLEGSVIGEEEQALREKVQATLREAGGK